MFASLNLDTCKHNSDKSMANNDSNESKVCTPNCPLWKQPERELIPPSPAEMSSGSAPVVRSKTLDNIAARPFDDDVQSAADLPKVVAQDDVQNISHPQFVQFSKVLLSQEPRVMSPPRIADWAKVGSFPSPLSTNPAQFNLGLSFVKDTTTILVDIISDSSQTTISREFVRAGPRDVIAFHPSSQVHACIVTCGGLCPGLNTVIRELVMTLKKMYGVKEVWGVPFGYRGFYSTHMEMMRLDEKMVQYIHHEGGSVLGSSRGGYDTKMICDAIESYGFNQVYIIGGDGTHRGALKIFNEMKRRKAKVVVTGIPKTIDNDIALIDQSFGFDTAVEEAQRSIKCAQVEARSAINGIGLVKLMGRHSGQIAMFATLASREVDCCLIPEVDFELEGPRGLFEYIEQTLQSKKHMVIVIAEGAAQKYFSGANAEASVDASGNVKPPDVGLWLKDKINTHFKALHVEINLKLIDPTYEIRSVPANASDSLHCGLLAQSSVHGAMAGFSGFSVGMINKHLVLIPIEEICRRGRTKVDIHSRMWHRVIATTKQPGLNGGAAGVAKISDFEPVNGSEEPGKLVRKAQISSP